MIEILSESERDTLAVVISGKLTEDDYKKLEPELDLRAGHDQDFDLVVELKDVEGMDASAIRQNLDFTQKYSDDIDHLALVTDSGVWEGFSKFLGKPVGEAVGVEVEHFSDRVDAWKWIREN